MNPTLWVRAQSSPTLALTQMAYSLLEPRRCTRSGVHADMAATKPTSVVLTRAHRDAIFEEIEFAFE
jgi:hypothetical protein